MHGDLWVKEIRRLLSCVSLNAIAHLYKSSCPSIRPSIRLSVHPLFGPSIRPSVHPSILLFVRWSCVIFDWWCLFLDDDEIWHGPRDSQGQFINDIKMSVCSSVCPYAERKWTKNADEVVTSYEPRGSCSSTLQPHLGGEEMTWLDGTRMESDNWNVGEPNNGAGIWTENCVAANFKTLPW